MKRFIKICICLVIMLIIISCKKEEKKEIVVYSTYEDYFVSDYINEFNKKYPDIKVNLVSESSGTITAKFEAEKNNPQVDVIWGVPITSIITNEDYLYPLNYNVENIDKKFYDSTSKEPKWVGNSVWTAAISFNKIEGKELAIPETYNDLLDEKYKGKIIMPNPASSGTGYLMVSALIQTLGEEDAWKYLDGLNKNIKMYVHSGSAPTRMVAQGETIIGLGMEFDSLNEEKKGMPLKTIFPKKSLGWELTVTAVVKKENIKPEAEIFAKWSIEKETMEKLYANNYGIVANSVVESKLNGYPTNIRELMIENNFKWAAENRDRILKEWERRYGKGE